MSGKTYGVGLVIKYNIDKDGYSFGPYVCRDSSFTKNQVAESNKIMEHLLNLSLKLSEFFHQTYTETQRLSEVL